MRPKCGDKATRVFIYFLLVGDEKKKRWSRARDDDEILAQKGVVDRLDNSENQSVNRSVILRVSSQLLSGSKRHLISWGVCVCELRGGKIITWLSGGLKDEFTNFFFTFGTAIWTQMW